MEKNEIKSGRYAEAHKQDQEKGEKPLAHGHEEAFFLLAGFSSALFYRFSFVLFGRH